MGLTKRWLDEEEEKRLGEEKAACGCRWNFDDKFEELCERHQADAEEKARLEYDGEIEAWYYLNEIQ